MTITQFSDTHGPALEQLLVDYFPEVSAGIPEDIIRGKLMDLIAGQWAGGILHILLAIEQDECIGFSIYQIDSPASDWCKRPGWGFIREFFITPSHRKQGFGRALAASTEQALRGLGAETLYLTSDQARPFWIRCGWQITEESASNNLLILEK